MPIAADRCSLHLSRPSAAFSQTLFGAFIPNPNPFSAEQPRVEEVRPLAGEDLSPHGGSQAVCVRTCDGGFFPLPLSARQSDPDQLTGLCQALCPNAPVSVYTRSPNQDISTSLSLTGDLPYSDLPNALKFQKSFDPACTCKPPGQSWAEALAGAEELLGRARKGDIVVTPESSAELAKPKFEKTARPEPSIQPSTGPEDPAGDRGGHRPRWGQAARPDNRAAALALPIKGKSAASSGPFSRFVKARRSG